MTEHTNNTPITHTHEATTTSDDVNQIALPFEGARADIFVFDDFHPEDNAMLQALYSRSPRSVMEHVDKVRAVGSGKFMESYYVGYGHASIGDCGSTTIYIENVSMLVAKAVQGHPLYSGQEASTRYLDFSKQAQHDPFESVETRSILQRWREIYMDTLPKLIAALKVKYPYTEAEYKKESTWLKTIEARAFDTARSLLPCGTATYVSWHTNLRQARDHLRSLATHPLAEVRDTAQCIYAKLYEKYAHSFTGDEMKLDHPRYASRHAYADTHAPDNFYLSPQSVWSTLSSSQQQAVRRGDVVVDDRRMDIDQANAEMSAVFSQRPSGALMPRRAGEYGVYRFTFLLDFGSYRDLQRHRNGFFREPIITNKFGFHAWYLNEFKALLSDDDYAALMQAMDEQFAAIKRVPCPSPAELKAHSVADAEARHAIRLQYLYPMGMNCLVQLTYSLPQVVCVSELRSGKTVHPSLRPIAQKMGLAVKQRHPDLALYLDMDVDGWTAKRGEQDIVQKKAG